MGLSAEEAEEVEGAAGTCKCYTCRVTPVYDNIVFKKSQSERRSFKRYLIELPVSRFLYIERLEQSIRQFHNILESQPDDDLVEVVV